MPQQILMMHVIRKFMEMQTITVPLIRELIDHIEVHETEGEGKYKTQLYQKHYRHNKKEQLKPALTLMCIKKNVHSGLKSVMNIQHGAGDRT